MKPYYDDGTCAIYHGDCREVLPSLSDTDAFAFDLALTDPPYNVGLTYDQHSDAMPADEYDEWTRAWWRRLRDVARRAVVFPGHGNLGMWMRIENPSGIGCWHKPGNPASGGVFQHCEWEPYLLYGRARGLPDVIRATITEQPGTGAHPCPKPLTLFRQIIAKSKAESVVDPFLGSGTTLRAAKDLGVPAVGIELSERYCEIAAKRLAQEVLPL